MEATRRGLRRREASRGRATAARAGVLAGLAVAAAARVAAACGPPVCYPARVRPDDGGWLTAGAPGLWFEGSRRGCAPPDPADGVELLTEAGDTVAIGIVPSFGAPAGGALIAPMQPLEPGRYRLRYLEYCHPGSGYDAASTDTREVGFTVTAAAPLPTSLGTLVASPPAPRTIETQRYPCDSDAWNALVVRLRLLPSEDAAPYLPVLAFTVFVDGVERGTTPYGALHLDGSFETTDTCGYAWDEQQLDELIACCEGLLAPGATCTNLPPGPHGVMVRGHVLSLDESTDPPPLAVEVAMVCPGPAPAADGGAPDAPVDMSGPEAGVHGGAAAGEPALDGGAPPDAAPTADAPSVRATAEAPGAVTIVETTASACSCRIGAPGGRRDGRPAAAVLGLASALALRRRQSGVSCPRRSRSCRR